VATESEDELTKQMVDVVAGRDARVRFGRAGR
jgi:hypothetical protein